MTAKVSFVRLLPAHYLVLSSVTKKERKAFEFLVDEEIPFSLGSDYIYPCFSVSFLSDLDLDSLRLMRFC